MRSANSRACRYTGDVSRVRAEPKVLTFRTWRYGANTLNA
jgi:hypothetical protein